LIRSDFSSLKCRERGTWARRNLSMLRSNNVMCLISSASPVGRGADLLSER